jgi:hypothetical protein
VVGGGNRGFKRHLDNPKCGGTMITGLHAEKYVDAEKATPVEVKRKNVDIDSQIRSSTVS